MKQQYLTFMENNLSILLPRYCTSDTIALTKVICMLMADTNGR